MSFAIYSDAGLTVEVNSLKLLHKTDGSLDPAKRQLWIGSTNSGEKLQAASNPGVDPLTLSITQLHPARANSEAILTGDKRRISPSNNTIFQANNNGTTAASPPTWNTTIGGTTVDGSVTWTAVAKEDTPDEIKLALTEAGLVSASPGAGLSLGTTILGGVGNAATFWLQQTDPDAAIQTTTQLAIDLVAADVLPV